MAKKDPVRKFELFPAGAHSRFGYATAATSTPVGSGEMEVPSYTPPTDTCWLYCVSTQTVYGGTEAANSISSPGGDRNVILGYQAAYGLTSGW